MNGKHILIDDEQDMDSTLLSDVKKKWNEWKRSSLERTKHSFEARRKRDIKRYGWVVAWKERPTKCVIIWKAPSAR